MISFIFGDAWGPWNYCLAGKSKYNVKQILKNISEIDIHFILEMVVFPQMNYFSVSTKQFTNLRVHLHVCYEKCSLEDQNFSHSNEKFWNHFNEIMRNSDLTESVLLIYLLSSMFLHIFILISTFLFSANILSPSVHLY